MGMIGMIVAFAGNKDKIAGIDGWLLCDGRTISRHDHAALFAMIGTLHGAGDGVNTFRLPDLRGYFLRGVAGTSTADAGLSERKALDPALGPAAANEAGSVQGWATALPARQFITTTIGDHVHGDPTWNGGPGPYELAAQNAGGSCRGPGGVDYGAESAPTTGAGGHSHGMTGGDPETRPANKYVHWLICAT